MQHPAISRKEMIRQLVDHSVATVLAESSQFWMREIFENGFAGYRLLSDQQLRMEMQLRGLDIAAEPADEDGEDEFMYNLAHI